MAHAPRHSKIMLHLSKPWELGEALGWRDLRASVGRRQGDRWLVELENPFHFHDAEYRYFVVSPRLEGWHLADADSIEVPCSLTPLSSETAASHNPCDVVPDDTLVGSATDYAA